MSAPVRHPGGAKRTRLIKAACGTCDYTVRVSRKWLVDLGPPLCPGPECAATPMDLPDWDPLTEWRAEGNDDHKPSHRVLRDSWVQTRTIHVCDRCRCECQRDEQMHHRVFTVNGELYNTYTCLACDNGGAEAHRAHAAETGFSNGGYR